MGNSDTLVITLTLTPVNDGTMRLGVWIEQGATPLHHDMKTLLPAQAHTVTVTVAGQQRTIVVEKVKREGVQG